MVHRLIVQYGQPTDPAEFDRHYRDVHVPLVQKVPGLVRFTVGHPRSMDPSTPAPYAIAELDFESAEAMGKALSTEEGRAPPPRAPPLAPPGGGVGRSSGGDARPPGARPPPSPP